LIVHWHVKEFKRRICRGYGFAVNLFRAKMSYAGLHRTTRVCNVRLGKKKLPPIQPRARAHEGNCLYADGRSTRRVRDNLISSVYLRDRSASDGKDLEICIKQRFQSENRSEWNPISNMRETSASRFCWMEYKYFTKNIFRKLFNKIMKIRYR